MREIAELIICILSLFNSKRSAAFSNIHQTGRSMLSVLLVDAVHGLLYLLFTCSPTGSVQLSAAWLTLKDQVPRETSRQHA